jgi:ABC-type antimicrobial peptide transport system permease subunit
MATTRRTRELGIRQVLGATRQGVVQLLTREQMVPVGAELAIGGLLAWWAVSLIKTDLYRVTSSDVRVWMAAALVILCTAALGILVPAVRASRTEPVQALRVE